MNWIVLSCFVWVNIIALQAHNDRAMSLREILDLIKKRNKLYPKNKIKLSLRHHSEEESEDISSLENEKVLKDEKIKSEKEDDAIIVEHKDLPKGMYRIVPGHTLLRPSKKMLKSAATYPDKTNENLVYGNLDNLGIIYNKSNERWSYNSFRKAFDLMNSFTTSDLTGYRPQKRKWILLEITPPKENIRNAVVSSEQDEMEAEFENNAKEILEGWDFFNSREALDYRRKRKHSKRDGDRDNGNDKHDSKKNRTRDDRSTSSETRSDSDTPSSSGKSSSEEDKNEGNPFTLHKGKYKQNWLWNHYMDGDHMNINPYAPEFRPMDIPSAKLFFGRKWWYFNQDDYKPMG